MKTALRSMLLLILTTVMLVPAVWMNLALAAPPCTYGIAPWMDHLGSSGGSNSVSVTAPDGCGWTATTTDSWIHITSGETGSGDGTVDYTVDANPDPSLRSGSMTIAGLPFTVIQDGTTCTYSIDPLNEHFPDSGGSDSVSITAADGCDWIATTADSWIDITSGSSGSGNGTVDYTIDPNPDPTLRVGGITIAGLPFTVIQDGNSCGYSIDPVSESFGFAGGLDSVDVTAPDGCDWTATTTDSWIDVTSGDTGSGNGTVNYTVDPNSNASLRTGKIMIAGLPCTIIQDGTICTYSVDPLSAHFPDTGGSTTADVTAPDGCDWTATTADSWINITSGDSGSGNGSVNFTIDPNPIFVLRTGKIIIAGLNFTITQDAADCTYGIDPVSEHFGFAGGSNSVSVTANAGHCYWAGTRNKGWINITSGSPDIGDGTLGYSVDPNTKVSARAGTMTIAGETFNVTQDGAPDFDNDSVADQEEQGPNGDDPNYDGNGDGFADWQQGNVVSMHTFDRQHYVTLESPAGTTFQHCESVGNPAPGSAPEGVDFEYGFFSFIVDGIGVGGATTVILHLPVGHQVHTYWKYGPTSGNAAPHWYEFLSDGQTGAAISGHVITLHFLDGERGDNVVALDGMIIEPGGPGLIIPVDPEEGGGGGGLTEPREDFDDRDGGGGGCLINTAASSLSW
ncbi:MAG: BACON domain-containing protein [Deltaproteobacteria bacterium]|nr:BACON domain-containing protein [Deltaproteobacteria bacterium]MBW1859731.1 BACON domain-containing protein [Deltaproteobacteria bacterium]